MKQQATAKVKVTGMFCSQCGDAIVESISAIEGVTLVRTDWQKNRVTLTYDLKHINFLEIERLLTDIGHPPDDSFLSRLSRGWVLFKEKNQIDNLKHVGACCSKPPKTANRR
ncbi:MAG: heavy-metal-associated domain-containing protein [Magnetococcales bacterium]|nr:heavy-metal-associated domain-containing protein [Magnetococcales bacterium]